MEVPGSGERVVVESLDAEEASVGGEADLPQRGQIHQTFPKAEVAGVVDGGLGLLVETHIRVTCKPRARRPAEVVQDWSAVGFLEWQCRGVYSGFRGSMADVSWLRRSQPSGCRVHRRAG